MQHSLKTALYLIVILLAGYCCMAFFIAGAVDRLNTAREEELKAVTMRQGLLRRVPKEGIAKLFGRRSGEPDQPPAEPGE